MANDLNFNVESTSDLGYLIRTARINRRLTLAQVSSVLGVSIQNLCNYEYGRVNLPKKYVVGISNLLGLDPVVVASFVLQNSKTFRALKKVAV